MHETLACVRSIIARDILGNEERDVQIGDITLRAHQRQALGRIKTLLTIHGGALLADETGLGKTFVALAAARAYDRVLVVAPAALCPAWKHAIDRSSVSADVTSFERLSRGATRAGQLLPQLVIVDESHHLRNPATRRYAAVAALSQRSRVLLLSATPLQNRHRDIVSQLALFLGNAASTMSAAEISDVIVRRKAQPDGIALPAVSGPHWLQLDIEDDLLDALICLPPPLPAGDEGCGGALVVYTLLRQWASSRAALVAALRRRAARAIAMIASLETGRRPTRRDLAAWSCAEESVQLAFPELLASGAGASVPEDVLAAVRAHERGIRDLLDRTRRLRDVDAARAEALRAIRARHPGARVVAFSTYAETVRSISRLLITDGGVAELTARGARIATGRLSRADVLAQLSPERSDRTSQAERVTLLITTDVLSEGLDLHAANVLVHLDLPWNPARLEQRIGRLRRIGARHDTVFVYALAPPAASERVLRVEQRLRAKLRLAHDVVGVGVQSLPALGFESQRAPPETASELHAMLEGWRLVRAEGHATVQPSGDGPRQFAFAGAIAAPAGFLALLADADARLLVGDIGRGVTSDPRAIVTLVRAITKARDRPIVTPELDAALRTVTRWAEARHGQRLVGVGAVAGARLRARLNQRIAALLATAPRHDRVRIAALASQAQALARRQRLTAGAERALAALVDAPMADEQWLREIIGLRDALPREDERVQMPRILALILVRPEA